MEGLPEPLLSDILRRISRTADRNSISLVCKHFYAIDKEHRGFLRVGCGLHPAAEALASLCTRFPNLLKVEIVYSGWIYYQGKQLDNQGLIVLSTHCPSLNDLTLSFCSFINDTGLGCLASCRNLRSFKLNFAPAISSNGILSLVVGCKKLSSLCLIHCMKVSSAEWLDYLGKFGTLENLSIKNCRGIGEHDLMKLGHGWKRLKSFEFEVDAYYRYPKVHEHLAHCCQNQQISYDELKELSLTNCIISHSGHCSGLSRLLERCPALEKLHLDMCIGVRDSDMVALSQKSSNLRCISLRLLAPALVNSPLGLTDTGLKALAWGCFTLEVVELSFSDVEYTSFSCFSHNGILTLVRSCPIRVLAVSSACFFDDTILKELCSAQFLQSLELVKCQVVSDVGIQFIILFPCLTYLKLCKCLRVTDVGLQPLVGTHKLNSLVVEDCPQISEKGVQGAARSISYKQDLSWL